MLGLVPHRSPLGLTIFCGFFLLVLLAACGDDTSTMRDTGPRPDASPCADADSDDDGFDAIECGGDDCNDGDPLIFPGAYDGPWGGPRLDSWAGLMERDAVLDMTTVGNTLHLLVVHSGVAFHVTAGDTGMTSDVVIGGGISDGAIEVVADTVHIVVAGSPGALSYQRREGDGDFEAEAVGAVGYDGARVSMVLGADGEPRVVYDNGGELLRAVRSAGTWTVDTVASDFCGEEVGCRIGYAITTTGVEHVVFVDDAGTTHHATGPSPWTFEEVGERGASASASVVVGADDAPVALIAGDGVSLDPLDGSAAVTVSSDAAMSPDATFAVDGRLHITFAATGALYHAVDTMGAFTPERVTGDWAGAASALVLGATDAPVIAAGLRRDADSGALYLMRRTGANGVDEDCDGSDWTE